MRKLFSSLLIFFLAVSAFSQKPTETELLRKNLYFLASDSLKGRFPGTPEDKVAANFIASDFRSLGLELFDNKALHPFQLVTSVEASDKNYAHFGSHKAIYDQDYSLYAFSENGIYENEIVFAGFGLMIQADTLEYNDYKDLDVKGKWVIALKGDPQPDDNNSPFIPFADARNKALYARDQGALGLILVGGVKNSPSDDLTPLLFERSVVSAGIPVLDIKKEFAQKAVFENKIIVDSLEAQLIRNERPNVVLSDIHLSSLVQLDKKETTTFNVVAYLKGSDPKLNDEFVVIGAHYDHLGMGGEGSGSRVPDTLAPHLGADDNGSGVVGLLNLAKRLSEKSTEIKRSIMFVSFGAEELGLLGSKHFVQNLPVDVSKIVAMLNMDMIGRLNDQNEVAIAGTGTAPNFEALLNELAGTSPLKLSYSPEGFGASDHASFYAADIPVLFYTTGAHPEYHTPADSPDKINYEGIVEVVNLVEQTVLHIANTIERPQFTEAGPKHRPSVRRGFKVTLGIMPNYTGGDEDGLGVDGVTSGGPADLAGIKKGDKIVGLNGMSVTTIYDYMNRLRQLKIGQRVNVDIVRDGSPMILIVDL